MLYYSVFNCYPYQGLDSILIFQFGKLVCSYPFKSDHGVSSVEFVNFLYQIEQKHMYHLSRPDAEDIIQKMDALNAYRETKNLIATWLEVSQKEDLQVAYRAARSNYIEAVRELDSASPTVSDTNYLRTKKEQANAIFKIVRRVYEQEHMLSECLPRAFDCLPEETIRAMYQQENGELHVEE